MENCLVLHDESFLESLSEQKMWKVKVDFFWISEIQVRVKQKISKIWIFPHALINQKI